MGRQAAGAGFLNGFVRHADVEQFLCHVLEPGHDEDFVDRVALAAGQPRACASVTLNGMEDLRESDRTLMLPDPAIGVHAWRRRQLGARGFSLCGINHTISSDAAMDGIGALLTSPVQPWDAVICTSRAAKAVIVRMLDNHADFLNQRGGGAFTAQVKLPVIPLGVDCDRFETGAERERIRTAVRRGLGIAHGDIAVLFFGRLSFHAKAHPLPMYLALEEAAARSGRRIHLLQTGRFSNSGIEHEFRDGARQFAPSINSIFLDGRDDAVCRDVWYAADIFTSLSDNMQESFGLTPIEAMAAGLPCVVTDWNGYKDTVRDGADGFAIPTWLPLPGSGGDLALQSDSLIGDAERDRNYNHYCGVVSQCTAVDVAKSAEAFSALIDNDELRQTMGQSGRRHARANFDWQVIVRAYQDLWRELAHVRSRSHENAAVSSGRPTHPLRDDPFSLFAGYSTHVVDGETSVRLAVSAQSVEDKLNILRAAAMNDFASGAMLTTPDILDLLNGLEAAAQDVFSLAESLSEEKRFRLPRTLAWLAKLGVVELTAPSEARVTAPTSATSEAARFIELGRGAKERGAWAAANDYFNKALRVDPGDAAANTELGNLLAGQGELEAAISNFRRSLNREPGNQLAQRGLGKALLVSGRETEGIATLENAASLAPEDPETHYLLGAAFRRTGEANKAHAALERCNQLAPDRPDSLTHLGLVCKSLGRSDEAVVAFERALEMDQENVFARAALMSRAAEADGRRRLAGSARAKRVALHMSNRGQFAVLEPVFNALREDHWPLITGDGRELHEFDPTVVVLAGEHTASLRPLAEDAVFVNLRHGLASRNFLSRIDDPGDVICTTSPHVAADMRDRSGLEADRFWITGHPALDPVFRGEKIDLAEENTGPRLIYVPTDRPLLSSAGLLAGRPVELLRGGREDISVILKPHPNICEQAPGWVAHWAQTAVNEPNVHIISDPAAPLAPYLGAADVLVTDASSAMLEFLALDRPVILITNPERFRDEAYFDPSGYEWAWRDMGYEVHDIELLSETVSRVIDGDDPHAERRAVYRQHLYADLIDGRAAERLAAHISKLDV